jgi:hypothetical protein
MDRERYPRRKHLSTTMIAAPQRRLWSRVANPTGIHYASLAVAAIVLFYLARNQWFFYDEWAFLTPGVVGPMDSHNGHWSLVPFLLTRSLEFVFGLDSYWPYYAAVLLAHLAIAHLLWRIMRRSGSNMWISTFLALVLMFLGAGSENILWEFQVGYLGAIAFALGAVLLVQRERMTPLTMIGAAALLTLGLASAGTAVPIAVIAAFIVLRLHGWRTTAVVIVPPAVIYLAWYFFGPPEDPSDIGASGIVDLLAVLPQYIGHIFVDGFQKFVPLPGLGAVIVAALLVWLVFRWRDAGSRAHVAEYALFGGGLLFAALTGLSRLSFGAETAASSRYIYVVLALSLPLIALIISSIAAHRQAVIVASCILLLGTTTFNLGTLIDGARAEASREQQTRGQLYAALDFLLHNPSSVDESISPVPQWAPNLDVAGLLEMHDRGWITVGSYTEADELTALTLLAIEISADDQVGECSALGATIVGIPADGAIVLQTSSDAELQLATVGTGVAGVPRSQSVPAGGFTVENDTGRQIQVSELPGDTKVCSG